MKRYQRKFILNTCAEINAFDIFYNCWISNKYSVEKVRLFWNTVIGNTHKYFKKNPQAFSLSENELNSLLENRNDLMALNSLLKEMQTTELTPPSVKKLDAFLSINKNLDVKLVHLLKLKLKIWDLAFPDNPIIVNRVKLLKNLGPWNDAIPTAANLDLDKNLLKEIKDNNPYLLAITLEQ
ncbi:hypothetical protein [[Mycoplasma] testudinis]|uniref:hypothetical protein n=1 Tax=[Mycoplasma] testudinis TaxID=33924 RepID=UPI000A3E967E|nr:hypothetical protein [[Mycoplasma] testudinis]